jgi:MCM P-loop domain/Toprim-like
MRLSAEALSAALSALGVAASSASSNGWATAMCPACKDDSRPSLRVNTQTGSYKCFRCGATSNDDGLNLADFVENPVSPALSADPARAQAARNRMPALTDELVIRYHRFLMDSPGILDQLERRRGWTTATVRQLKLGYDGSYFWIPIYDVTGVLVNARMYDPFKRTTVKSFHYANDDGLKRTTIWLPFGKESIADSEEIWFYEGEPDAILAAQCGFPAAVITGGAGAWTDAVIEVIAGRRVVVCYDMDAAGRRGARTVVQRIRSRDLQVTALEFKLESAENKDFSDAVLKENRTPQWFRELAERRWRGEDTRGEDIQQVHIPVKLGAGTPGEPITVKAHVLGTEMVPTLVPQAVEARCRMDWDPERCATCPVGRANGNLRREYEAETKDVLVFAAKPALTHDSVIKGNLGIPARCNRHTIEVASMWQIQHVKLIPPLSDRHGGDATVRSALHISAADGRPLAVKSNQVYVFSGKIVPDVMSNEWTLVSPDARPAEDDIDSFRLDDTMFEHLTNTFKPDDWVVDSVDAKMAAEERSIARHVTRVYGRELILRAVDLVYHSVLQFPFKGRVITRGWLSLGVIGDTRTGKSETMSAMCTYLGLGKYVMDPANTTYAGLVGGLQQIGHGDKSWAVTWGLVPTNDRGLVIIDEVSSMTVEDIGRMSGMRSSGVAEITKIRSAATMARTRLIMAGNPRGLGRSLASYPTPAEGFMELIGAPEDVARFDLALGVKMGVDKDAADDKLGEQPQPALIDLRRALVKFAWSRTPDQVSWEAGAEDACVVAAGKMVKNYDHTVPLVEPSEQDLKVARVAVAIAVRSFSVSPDDHNVVLVRKCHVDLAERVMRAAFDQDLQYSEFSRFAREQRLDSKAALVLLGNTGSDVKVVCRALLMIRAVNQGSISMTLAMDSNESRIFIAKLAQIGAAKFDTISGKSNSSMVWTSDFMAFLRDLERMEHVPRPPEVDNF